MKKNDITNFDQLIEESKGYNRIPAVPSFGFSTALNKIVVKNQEAFWLLGEIADDPKKITILDGCPLQTDEDFKKWACKQLKKQDVTTEESKNLIIDWAREALGIADQVDEHTFQIFKVDADNPNNIEDMAGISSKKRNKFTHVTKLNEGYDAPEK
jgi:hypothetical protein